MSEARPAADLLSPRGAALARGTSYFVLWMLLMPSLKVADLVIGLGAASAATIVSLRMLPPSTGRVHFASLLALMPHFIWESVVAGFDVARRAFDPQLPVQPGFVACPLDFPEGTARNTFAVITGLMPGAVPCGDVDGVLIYHCLDVREPVVEQLWAEERLFARALIAGSKHG